MCCHSVCRRQLEDSNNPYNYKLLHALQFHKSCQWWHCTSHWWVRTDDLQWEQNHEEFLKIYEAPYCDTNDQNYDDDIKEHIAKKNKIKNGESDNDHKIIPVKSFNPKRKKVEKLQLYFMQDRNEESSKASLDTCADFIHMPNVNHLCQKKLTDFLNCQRKQEFQINFGMLCIIHAVLYINSTWWKKTFFFFNIWGNFSNCFIEIAG